ncbi:MAG: hypothetical protein ACRDRV_02345 [Pseudonocardiaceae bacterium]
MHTLRSASVVILAVLGITSISLLTGLTDRASADTGACTSYLENIGEDTTVRVHLCAETEAIGDGASQEVAMSFCIPAMGSTGLPPEISYEACELALAP